MRKRFSNSLSAAAAAANAQNAARRREFVGITETAGVIAPSSKWNKTWYINE